VGESVTNITIGKRELIIIGTAHVSNKSVLEVEKNIRLRTPDTVCIEIDESRYRSISEQDAWKNLSIPQVLRQGKGFLLLANLVLSSFQKRIGLDLGVKPGEEMMRAIEVAKELNIPYAFCDREINITFKRAWAKTDFRGKVKMLAAMASSVFTNEKLSPTEIEKLKEKNELENMLDELSKFLPSIKTVLIDERDRNLATKIFEAPGNTILAVVGAGHVPGIISALQMLDAGKLSNDLTDIETIPKPKVMPKIVGFLIPILIIALIVAGFVINGYKKGLKMIIVWIIFNGGGAALGSLLALAHPITILAAIPAAPIATLNPFIAVGVITGLIEYRFRKPRVADFEKISDDVTSFRGWYRNRIIRILLVFFLSSLGGVVGNFTTIIPYFTNIVANLLK
jgi:pheromone shutdown-related protein TraB